MDHTEKAVEAPISLLDACERLQAEGASRLETFKQISGLLEKKARRQAIPIHGSFELTPLCNLDCKMCYVHLEADRFSPKDLLPPETWIRLIAEARNAGMLRASMTGGECLTYPGFDEVYRYLYGRGIGISILSNGILMDEKRIAFLKQYPPRAIQITIYGADEEEYKAVTGHRAAELVFGNIRALRDAGLPVRASLTPNRFMNSDVRPLLERVEGLGIPYQINSALMAPRSNTGRERQDIPPERYAEIYVRLNEMLGRASLSRPETVMQPAGTVPDEECVPGVRCGAGRSCFAIRSDGKMCPCPGLGEITAEPLVEGFRTAWHRINEKAASWPAPAECDSCAYSAVCVTCPAVHKGAEPGHCDRRMCARTREMARAGLFRTRDDTNRTNPERIDTELNKNENGTGTEYNGQAPRGRAECGNREC